MDTTGAWLIEDGRPEKPTYVILDEWRMIRWTFNPFEAYRFPTEQLARVMADWHVGVGVRVCYHEFEAHP